MGSEEIVRVTSEAMMLCLVVSLPAVLVAAGVGLLVAFVQAVTSLQEQAISQGAKMISVVVTLLLAAPWGARLVLEFARSMMRMAMS
ncbi:type III secretion system export apparatus subunit SctS [Piscinibacter terrae]|jgi:type III secretion protein S|uniref:EscS/YscS/HrcS family type III secretion system export apparatus protein n=1 Tax=Piscinibacter terrae TaxID=2496871 RepID=A0A3N7HKU5_9BURK|nr:type III secretion system export apparatus subunit SctS [Albitalea terrae]RQP22728.1 EscS/YscS/HrcS family type III secretion system export apparatus protein [Albitalea terrae]